jgi:hypothetical protein
MPEQDSFPPGRGVRISARWILDMMVQERQKNVLLSHSHLRLPMAFKNSSLA